MESVDHCHGSLEVDSEIVGGEVDWRVDVGVVPADLGMRSLGMCRWTLLCSKGNARKFVCYLISLHSMLGDDKYQELTQTITTSLHEQGKTKLNLIEKQHSKRNRDMLLLVLLA